MAATRTTYITTSIPSINGRPHVGHALEFVQADAFARYRVQVGDTVRLQTGTDDNSLKNVLAADREGIPPPVLVERNAGAFRALLDSLEIRYDGFLRTSTDPRHRRGVHALWQACDRAGAIYRQHYSGLYCVGCEAFYTEDELTAEGLCPEHLTLPEIVEEENYFFRLSRYAEALRDRIASGALRITPESRRNEVLAFIDGGLRDFAKVRLVARYNADLANDLGNLLNRTAAMLHRYRGGLVPAVEDCRLYGGDLPAIADGLPNRLAGAMAAFDPRAALGHLWDLVAAANRLVDESAPWALYRAERAGDSAAARRLDGVLYALLEALRLAGVHLEPFLPRAAAELCSRLGLGATETSPYEQRVCWGGLPAGVPLAAPMPLFPRLSSPHERAD
jgi:methionyl-tRNA synthetase